MAPANAKKTVEWLDDEQQQKTEAIKLHGVTYLLMIANGDIVQNWVNKFEDSEPCLLQYAWEGFTIQVYHYTRDIFCIFQVSLVRKAVDLIKVSNIYIGMEEQQQKLKLLSICMWLLVEIYIM